ncbi:MAG: PQQ-binding-like beta-propeller repeat protein, partial [Bacteroidota bacterium]
MGTAHFDPRPAASGAIQTHVSTRVSARGLWRSATLALAVVLVGCQSLALDRAPGTTPEAPPEAPAPPLAQAWRIDAEAAFGPEAPVVTADGRIFVGTRDGKVVVVDGRTGSREGK